MISRELLNNAYLRLEEKRTALIHALAHPMFDVESGWYNGHYQKNDVGEWVRDAYPIPVITVKELCDIEIQFHGLSVSTKLRRDAAIAYSFEKMMAYEFEAYGVENYLSDYYHPGQTVEELKDNLKASDETEIGFSFSFPLESEGQQILAFAKLLRQEGFYY